MSITINGSLITCPYCGHVHHDSWEIGPDSAEFDTEHECHSCGRTMFLSKTIKVTYQTWKREDDGK